MIEKEVFDFTQTPFRNGRIIFRRQSSTKTIKFNNKKKWNVKIAR